MSSTRSGGILRGFSTIGCPAASLPEACALASEFGMDFLELRALAGSVDLPRYFAAEPFPAKGEKPDPPVRIVATNLHLIQAGPEEIAAFLEFVDVADRLGAPYVRVFGGGAWGETLSPGQWKHGAEVVEECRAAIRTKGSSCEMLLETHSAFCSSSMCMKLNELISEPLNILWDAHHTWRSAGESPGETWLRFGYLVRHMHFSDSRLKAPPQTGYDCVLPGAGEYPVEALQSVLATNHYSHSISLEWEKLWHPELPDIRQALEIFAGQF